MKKQMKAEDGGCINTKSRIESLPSCLLVNDILLKLDLENLCTLSCVSTVFRSSASQALALLPSLDLSGFSTDIVTMETILAKCRSIKALTLNCLRFDYFSCLLCPTIEELNLLCCFQFPPNALNRIRENCPNIRSLMLEMDDCVDGFSFALFEMLIRGCDKLESFQLKIRGEICPIYEVFINDLPPTIRSLKLESLDEDEAVQLVCGTNPSASTPFINVMFLQTLQNLSLVLDVISDRLVLSITKNVPHLLELHLKDRPKSEPTRSQDLTNAGIKALSTCFHLKSLFLARSSRHCQTSFKRVKEKGIFLLSEGCRDLESIGLSGFSKVSDAGFTSILHSCPKLRKFEVQNAALLTDLTFHGLSNAPCPLEEVKLVACSKITSETVMNLSSKSRLEILNLGGCRSVADMGIKAFTSLNKLICLDLAGADITDTAILVLSGCSSPIKSLSLRGCVKVTAKGIVTLFQGGGTAAKTLSTLDLGYIHGITDVAIEAVAFAGNAITELCIRGCFKLTDSSMRSLARKGQLGDGKNLPLRKLDIFYCRGLTAASLGLFRMPYFRGLWWLGVASNVLDGRRIDVFKDVLKERSTWLAVCADGCEMGCYDGWPTFEHHMHILGHHFNGF